jgi:2-polyprenyl-3-methyl-5-hydroxy-6-metoxy-1,4-benzoquinol methylase
MKAVYKEMAGMKNTIRFVMQQIMHLKLPEFEGKKYSLDIGCARGETAYAFEKAGFVSYGIDPSEGMVEQAVQNGLNCFAGFFPDDVPEEISQRKFSIITIFETIYYLENIHELFKWAKDHLMDGGYLVIKSLNGKSPNLPKENFFKRAGDNVKCLPQKASLAYFAKENDFRIVELKNVPDNIFVEFLGIDPRNRTKWISISIYITSLLINKIFPNRNADKFYIIAS